MMPQRVRTMRGPNAGTGMSSGHGSALASARLWLCDDCQHGTYVAPAEVIARREHQEERPQAERRS
jgi:hypothetical protein